MLVQEPLMDEKLNTNASVLYQQNNKSPGLVFSAMSMDKVVKGDRIMSPMVRGVQHGKATTKKINKNKTLKVEDFTRSPFPNMPVSLEHQPSSKPKDSYYMGRRLLLWKEQT